LGRLSHRAKNCGNKCIDKERFQCIYSNNHDNKFSPQPEIFDGYDNSYKLDGCAVEQRLLNPHVFELWENYQYSDIKDLDYKATPFLQFFVIQVMKEDVLVYKSAMKEKEG